MALPSASQWSPLSQRSSTNQPISSSSTAPAAVPSDDEDDVAELVALLARARLVPTSSRRPVAAMLCAAGVGSAEALLLALDRDPSFLSNQVHFVTFAAWFARYNTCTAAVAVPAPSRLHRRLHPQYRSFASCTAPRPSPSLVLRCCWCVGCVVCSGHTAQSTPVNVFDSDCFLPFLNLQNILFIIKS